MSYFAQPAPQPPPAAKPWRPWVTRGLVAANVIVFLVMCLRGVSPMEPLVSDLVLWGGDFGPQTVGLGELWRLFTCTFLHAGLIHIAFNMVALWQVGGFCERLYGRAAYLFAYVAAGLFGSLLSVMWHPVIVGVGASGAIFGVYGALLSFLILHHSQINPKAVQSLWTSTLGFVGYNLFYGFTSQVTDNAAHVGGLLGGMLAGLALVRPLGGERSWARAMLGTAAVTGILGLTAFGMVDRVTRVPAIASVKHLHAGYQALRAGDRARAMALFTQSIADDPEEPGRYLARAGLESEVGKEAEAIADYDRALVHDPKNLTALANRCWLLSKGDEDPESRCTQAVDAGAGLWAYLGRGNGRISDKRYKDAEEDLTYALGHFPPVPVAYYLRGFARNDLENTDGALEDWGQAVRLAGNDSPDLVGRAHMMRATTLWHQKRRSEALSEAELALKILPDEPALLSILAEARKDGGD